MCKNFKLLLNGACVDEAQCTSGLWNHEARFDRQCLPAPTLPPVPTTEITAPLLCTVGFTNETTPQPCSCTSNCRKVCKFNNK